MDKKLVRLLSVVVAVIIGAWIAVSYKSAEVAQQGKQLLFPEFAGAIENITDINITTPNGEFDLLQDASGLWMVKQYMGYPVDMKRLRNLVYGIAELEIIEKKTAKAENHIKLGIQDPTVKGAKSTRVVFGNGKDKRVELDVVLGDLRKAAYDKNTDGFYIRKFNEDQVWLVKGYMGLDHDFKNWVDRTILAIPRERIASVDIKYSGKNRLQLKRISEEEKAPFELMDVPEGKDVKKEGLIEGTAAALAGLQFNAFKVLDEKDFPKKRRLDVQYQTTDGLILDFELITKTEKKQKKKWMRLKASTNEDAKKEVKEEAKRLNLYHAKWAYEIGDFYAKPLMLKKSELF